MSSVDLSVIYGRDSSIFKKTARDALGFHFVYRQPITKTSIYSVFEAITNDDIEGTTFKKCDSCLVSPDHDDGGDSLEILESLDNDFDDSLDFEEPDFDFEHDFEEPYFEATDFDHDLPAGEPLSSKFAGINHISDLAALLYGDSAPTPTPISTPTPTPTAGVVSWATEDVLKAAGLNDDMSPIAKDNEDGQSTLETLLDSDDTPPKDADISFKGDAYILAYRDKKSSENVVITALESDKEGFELLLKELNDFLSRNCGYCDFQARWMNNSSHNSQYDNVRVITAFNTKGGQEEVLFVSQKMGSSQVDEDTVGLTNIVDIGFAIDGLIVNGVLDFQIEALEAKGETCDDVPVVVLAQLRNPYRSISNFDNDINSQDLIARALTFKDSPFNRDRPEVRYDETNRYINKVVSNDPHHNSTANTKTYDVFDYSIFAHRSRYKSITKYNENVPQIAKPLLEKCWLFGSDTLSKSYYTHWKKSLADKGNLKNSLVLSKPFLAAFFKLSNRGFNLEIRETRGVVGSYHIAVYHKNHLSDNDFVPPASVQVSMDKDSQRFIYKGKDALFDIGQLLQKGWTDQTTSGKWSHERKYHVVTQGKLSDLTAHWLWLVLAEQMLTADLKYAAYYKTKGSFESHYIDNGTIYVDSHNKTVYSLSEDYNNRQSSHYLQTSINRQYSNSLPVEVVAIPISGVKFKVGQALFEVYAKGLIPSLDKCLSLFISGQNEGFYQKDRNHTTYTLLETDASGAITTIYSFVDISGAIKKMVSMLVENEYVKAMGMDVFDVTRSVVATGRALGCEIGIGFTFENVKTDFSDRDITLISQDNRSISEIQDFDLDM